MAGQRAWIEAHYKTALSLILEVAEIASTAWTSMQLNWLAERDLLRVKTSQWLDNWSQLQQALSGDNLHALNLAQLQNARRRGQILKGTDDPAVISMLLNDAAAAPDLDENALSEIRQWAATRLRKTTREEWDKALSAPEGGALAAIAMELSGTVEAPTDPPGVDDALFEHFQRVASGDEAWMPTQDDFFSFTRILGDNARQVRASEMCAWLEGRSDGVSTSTYSVYGRFLASEQAFRTHAKLPNFIERLVANSDWETVGWVVEMASECPDTLSTANRQAEMSHLKSKINERIDAYEDGDVPAHLLALSELTHEKPAAVTKS